MLQRRAQQLLKRPLSYYNASNLRHKNIELCRRSYASALILCDVELAAITMPSLSPTMTHGTIAQWKANPGDELKAGDVLCEIETDKASVAYEMQDDCVLAKVLAAEQSAELACGQPIALTVEDKADYEAFLKMDASSYQHLLGDAASEAVTVEELTSAGAGADAGAGAGAASDGGEQRMSPAAKHMVASMALDTSRVQGTGPRGLISKSDVVLALQSGAAKVDPAKQQALRGALSKQPPPAAAAASEPSASTPKQAQTPAAAAPAPAPARLAVEVSREAVNEHYEDIPNSNMRKVIAKRLTESKATVPHFYTSAECEIDALLKLRKQLKNDFQVNVSVNDLVIKSAALALRDVPEANAKWGGAAVDVSGMGAVDISVAVATPNGLITPIVAGADRRGLADINAAVRDLATRARDGKLKPEEYQGGSFSISNLGMFGISSFSAVINPPQACILAVGAGIKKVLPPTAAAVKAAAASGNKLQPRIATTVTVQLSGDRRVVDEGLAAQFLQVFRGYLSNPSSMLL